MLHRIKLPSYERILNSFLQFQKQLLEFACTPTLSLPLTEDALLPFFPDNLADWFWKKLWKKDGSASDLNTYLLNVISYIQTNLQERSDILRAFEHDVDFYNHLDDPTFRFCFPLLKLEAQRVIKPLMMQCYQLLCQGFPIEVSSGSKQSKFTRHDLVDRFWRENEVELTVCPACDGQRPLVTEGKTYADADHFFPESIYPYLSIHPLNLVPVCRTCNSSLKGAVDPIEDHANEPMIHIFHPYGRPAIEHIYLEILKVERRANEVQIYDLTQLPFEMESNRLKNLRRVMRLHKVWAGSYLDDVVAQIYREIRELRRSRIARKEPIDANLIKDRLEMIVRDYNDRIGLEIYYFVKYSYAWYVLTHLEEFNRLVRVLMGEDEA